MDKSLSTGALLPVVQLAAPHTWPAAVTSVLLGTACAWASGAAVRPWCALLTLITAVLLQSAVNTLNDWRDFRSGLDTAENCTDPTDAALLYTGVTPRGALAIGLSFLLLAALGGASLCLLCGAALIWYGLAAAACIGLYVLPGLNLSDRPFGELLSGAAMGLVLPCAAYHAQAGEACRTWWCFFPAALTIGCIMLANNGSDIEKDRAGGRATLAVLIGRKSAVRTLLGLEALAAALCVCFTLLLVPKGAPALIVLAAGLLLSRWPRGLVSARLLPEKRRESMAGALAVHSWITGAYAACMVLDALSR